MDAVTCSPCEFLKHRACLGSSYAFFTPRSTPRNRPVGGPSSNILVKLPRAAQSGGAMDGMMQIEPVLRDLWAGLSVQGPGPRGTCLADRTVKMGQSSLSGKPGDGGFNSDMDVADL